MTAREGASRERRVSEPSDVWRRPVTVESRCAQIREVEQQRSKYKHPVAEGIQTWERHVARADHQRHEIIAKSRNYWHAHQKDHRRPVHGEETIEDFRFQKRVVRYGKLQANGD